MIGLIMAGGKGTRMQSDEEKLLLEYKKPLVLHVIDALKNSNSDSVLKFKDVLKRIINEK